MLQIEKLNRILLLVALFNFFVYMLSTILLVLTRSLEYLLNDTFLETFISIVSLFFSLAIIILQYTTFIFFIGSLILFFMVFIVEYLAKDSKFN